MQFQPFIHLPQFVQFPPAGKALWPHLERFWQANPLARAGRKGYLRTSTFPTLQAGMKQQFALLSVLVLLGACGQALAPPAGGSADASAGDTVIAVDSAEDTGDSATPPDVSLNDGAATDADDRDETGEDVADDGSDTAVGDEEVQLTDAMDAEIPDVTDAETTGTDAAEVIGPDGADAAVTDADTAVTDADAVVTDAGAETVDADATDSDAAAGTDAALADEDAAGTDATDDASVDDVALGDAVFVDDGAGEVGDDAGTDADNTDAASTDAASTDAASMDAETSDAASTDAGSADDAEVAGSDDAGAEVGDEADSGADADADGGCKPTIPATEVCDGIDNDCDGQTDNGACNDANDCTTDSCDPKKGCSNTILNGVACNDSNACTIGDMCDTGSCIAGGQKTCPPASQCHVASCDTVTGNCGEIVNPSPYQIPCVDSDPCTNSEYCKNGACVGTAITNCNDSNACTDDSCDNTGGCTYVFNANSCSDGENCTKNDACINGGCVAGKTFSCDDSNPCTDDACTAAGGCDHVGATHEGELCNADSNACTVGDVCTAGVCTAGKLKVCDDGNLCTTDTCDKYSATCKYTPPNDAANLPVCDDGNKCTKDDYCQVTAVCSGQPLNCDDGKVCTTDGCDANLGVCVSTATPAVVCTDGNACTLGDLCDSNGNCVPGVVQACDDGQVCTGDTCDATDGCKHASINSGPCDDGSVCTKGETCVTGQCIVPSVSQVSTFAGQALAGLKDGVGTIAQFSSPRGIVFDSKGVAWLADTGNNAIRKIAADATVSTVSLTFVDPPNTLFGPQSLAVDASGNLWIADTGNHRIVKRTTDGNVHLVAGTGIAAWGDGKGGGAAFNTPTGIAIGPGGWLYVADKGNNRIRRIAPDGTVTTLAGSGAAGSTNGTGVSATFNAPSALMYEPNSNSLYVTDSGSALLRIVSLSGVVTLGAGSTVGFQDGNLSTAKFNGPTAILGSASGVIIVDTGNNKIRQIGSSVTTVLGTTSGFKDGGSDIAQFSAPQGLAYSSTGSILVADTGNNRIRLAVQPSVTCFDANPCTTDACDSATGCTFTVVTDGGTCTDNDACTTGDACTGGVCTTTAKSCDDSVLCTDDGCDPLTGTCSHNANSAPCTDNSACTIAESCQGGACKANVSTVSLLAGASGTSGSTDGSSTLARFNKPMGIAPDGNGGYIIADASNNKIRAVASDGTTSTIAGNGTAAFADGAALSASFSSPTGIAVGSDGSIYVADKGNHRIRKISGGTVSTYAGSGTISSVDGYVTAATFSQPSGIAIDRFGIVYVSEVGTHHIRKITPDGAVTTLAGSGNAKFQDGIGTAASFYNPSDITVDWSGNVFVADTTNQRIRKIAPDGTVTTVAGSGTSGFLDSATPLSAQFSSPTGIFVDWDGVLYLADTGNKRVRIISGSGVSTWTGSGAVPPGGTVASVADILVDVNGTGVITDSDNVLRKIALQTVHCNDNNVCTLDVCDTGTGVCAHTPMTAGAPCDDGSACTTSDVCGGSGCVGTAKSCDDSNVCTSDFCDPFTSVCKHSSNTLGCNDGNACTLGESCVAGTCTAEPGSISTLAGQAITGSVDGSGGSASFSGPRQMWADSTGGVYVADTGNNKIRRVTADGTVSTFAGTGTSSALDGVAGTATFKAPQGLTVDGSGTMWVADTGNHKIRMISGGYVSTPIGTGTAGWKDGAGAIAQFNGPQAIVADSSGLLFVADTANHRIRKIASDYTVSTLAGTGTAGFKDGVGSVAQFSSPGGIAVDAFHNVYVSDMNNYRIRKISPDGVVSTIAGSGSLGQNDGAALSATFGLMGQISFDPGGNLWIVEHSYHTMRKLGSGGTVSTVGGSTGGFLDGPSLTAKLSSPYGVAFTSDGNVFIGDTSNNRIRKRAATAIVCGDGNDCTTDSCNSLTGVCASSPVSDGASCQGGNACNTGKICGSGTCGGGSAKACSDGDPCTSDGCDTTSGACSWSLSGACLNVRRTFVSSATYTGNLGGSTGADSKCQTLANTAGLGGTWMAWLSDSSSSPSVRFSQSGNPYVLLDRTPVASSWSDLTDGALSSAISQDETGKTPAVSQITWCSTTPIKVFTNTRKDGTAYFSTTTNTCNNWTSNSSNQGAFNGLDGDASGSNSLWTEGCASDYCDRVGRLYCFEQTDKAVLKSSGYHMNGKYYVSNATYAGDFNASGGFCTALVGQTAYVASSAQFLSDTEPYTVWGGNGTASSAAVNCSFFSNGTSGQSGAGAQGGTKTCDQKRSVVCSTDPNDCAGGSTFCGNWD